MQFATLERSGPLRVPAQREFRPSDVRGFFTNERDKSFLAHIDMGRALASQSRFAYPSANLLVVFGSHSFGWGDGQKETYARSRPNFYLDSACGEFWLRQLIVLLGLMSGNRSKPFRSSSVNVIII
jgi:hypothetical protein